MKNIKKTLSILLAGTLISVPLSTNAYAQDCKIKQELGKIIIACTQLKCNDGAARLFEMLESAKLFGQLKNKLDNPVPQQPEKPSENEQPPQQPPKAESNEGDSQQAQNNDSQSLAQEIARLVNSYRAENGVASVELDVELCQAAQKRSVEQETVFSHTRPNGTSCFTVLDEYGISYMAAGENIAMGQRTASEVMNDWMNSEGHRKNILSSSFTKLGVGVYVDENGKHYWTQLFIR